jgi:hypothetical protein
VVHQRHSLYELLHVLVSDLAEISMAAEILVTCGQVIATKVRIVGVGKHK